MFSADILGNIVGHSFNGLVLATAKGHEGPDQLPIWYFTLGWGFMRLPAPVQMGFMQGAVLAGFDMQAKELVLSLAAAKQEASNLLLYGPRLSDEQRNALEGYYLSLVDRGIAEGYIDPDGEEMFTALGKNTDPNFCQEVTRVGKAIGFQY